MSRWTVTLAFALVVCVLSLLPVLYVNNALNVVETVPQGSVGTPLIEVEVEDPCNSIADAVVTVEVTPDESRLDIQSSVDGDSAPCKFTPYALVTTSNLSLRTPDGTKVGREFAMATGPVVAIQGMLERAASSSSFAVPLKGGDAPAGGFVFAAGALDAGFGESVVRVELLARNLTCSDPGPEALPRAARCDIPLRLVLEYANEAFDVAATLPPTYYLASGPDIGARDSKEIYSTTRLLWPERPTSPSTPTYFKATRTAFEIRLASRRSQAIKQFTTVAGSAVFAAVIAILCGQLIAFEERGGSRATDETPSRLAAPREEVPSSGNASTESPDRMQETRSGNVDASPGTLGGVVAAAAIVGVVWYARRLAERGRSK